MTKTIAFVLAATAAASLSPVAEARGMTMRQAGTLTCNMDPALGLVLGSVRGVSCAYDRLDRRGRIVRETYAGRMDRAGFDVGLTGAQTVSWRVSTPGGMSRRGMLSGTFSGSSSDASVVVGAGTRSMFGEDGRPVTLDPVGNSGQVGIGLGFGVSGLDLRRVPAASYMSYAY